MPQPSADILVIGAGMAGLTAARTLAEAGRSVTVLEASPRIGGRILTHREGTEIIELGAEFIHGRPPELWSLIEEAGLETYESNGPNLSFEDNQLRADTEETPEQHEAFTLLDHLESYTGPDLPFADYLAQHPLPDDARHSAIGYVEGFNAADHRIISVLALGLQQSAEDSVEGDRIFRVRDGYDRLPQFLADKLAAAGAQTHLDTLVERIEWAPDRVQVQANSAGQPRIYEAAKAIITVPLGVLLEDAIEFFPVPTPVEEARRLRMGNARRFTLLFREKFWATPNTPAPDGFSFLFAFGSMPPVWWTPHPASSNTITGWIGGPRSAALANLTADQLGALACDSLAPIFSSTPAALRANLIRCFTHDWQHDALTFGAYSYVPAGALDACSKMTIPADNTLYFAGEHTDTTGHWGTVHAAIRTGLRAAQQILHPPVPSP